MIHRPRLILRAAAAAVFLLMSVTVGAHASGPPRVQDAGWSVLKTHDVGPFANSFAATAAVSPSDVWAVGCTLDTKAHCHALTEHWNGATWSVIPSPGPAGAAMTELLGVSADSPTDVWAVGDFTLLDGTGGQFVLRWNGSTWSQVATPPGGRGGFQAVSAISPDDVWAVGGLGAEHWDGHTWSIVAVPRLGQHGGDLQGVTAVSSTDVWMVGSSFDRRFRSHALILHWDGTSWSLTPSPNTGASSSLVSVSAVSATDVWAVGQDFPSNTATLIEHWNGASWTVVPSPNVPVSRFTGVAAVSSTDVWAVGSSLVAGGPTGATTQTLAERWDGSTWSVSATPTTGFLASEFGNADGTNGGAVAATATMIFAVGNFVDSKNNERTLAEAHAA